MTTASSLVNQTVNPQYPFRNRVRNGAMLVDQRGTASAAIVAGTSVTAGSFVVGTRYIITAVGTTSFTGIGASANTVGVSFIATGVGSGTGTARVAPYTLDGFCVNAIGGGIVSTQQVTDAPVGFSKSLKCTITTADASLGTSNYYQIQQMIEGQDLVGAALGTASASSLALSFWVKSSVAGTFAAALQNGAQNRTYPVTFAVASTGTWQQVKLIIAGDGTGTWATDTTNGCSVIFTLGAGTNYNGTSGVWAGTNTPSVSTVTSTLMSTVNSTFQITGVQLELNTQATPFEYVWLPTDMTRNQRYLWINQSQITATGHNAPGSGWAGTQTVSFASAMRATPTLTQTFSSPVNISSQSTLNTSATNFQIQVVCAGGGNFGSTYSANNIGTAELA